MAKILDALQARDLLIKRDITAKELSKEKGPMSNRSKVIAELVDTERKYVQDLEVLQSYMNALTKSEVVTLDFIHMMFLNLNALVDFQRRFLIKVESLNILPAEQQHWGKLFLEFVSLPIFWDVRDGLLTNKHSRKALLMSTNPIAPISRQPRI